MIPKAINPGLRAVFAPLSLVSEELKHITSVKILHSELERKGHAFNNHLTEGCWQEPFILMKYCFSNHLQRQHRKCKNEIVLPRMKNRVSWGLNRKQSLIFALSSKEASLMSGGKEMYLVRLFKL